MKESVERRKREEEEEGREERKEERKEESDGKGTVDEFVRDGDGKVTKATSGGPGENSLKKEGKDG